MFTESELQVKSRPLTRLTYSGADRPGKESSNSDQDLGGLCEETTPDGLEEMRFKHQLQQVQRP